MKMNFYCRAVIKKDFVLSFILKVRVFRIWKWPKFYLDQFIKLCADTLSVSATEYFL